MALLVVATLPGAMAELAMPPAPSPARRLVVAGAPEHSPAAAVTLPEASVCRHLLNMLGNTSLAVPVKFRLPVASTVKPAVPRAETWSGAAAEPDAVVTRSMFPVPVEAAFSPILKAPKPAPFEVMLQSQV